MSTPFSRYIRRVGAALCSLALLAVSACWHDNGEPGPLGGPSTLALSIRMDASPDILPFDGAAQSIVTVTVQDETGEPISGLALTVQIVNGGTFVDVGQLSSRSLTTDGSGRAVFAYTAPLLSVNPAGAPDPGSVIVLQVTPSSGDFANNLGRTVQIRLVPPGNVIPSFDIIPGFQFTPGTPTVFDQVRFSAALCPAGDTTSTDCTRDPSGLAAEYSWDFGDGGTAVGQEVSHVYTEAGAFLVRLTVRDAFNRSAEVTGTVDMGAGTPPTASFVFSPAAPNVDDTVFFDATDSTGAGGRQIVSYDWNFGDGATATGITASHPYDVADVYNVTLTVTDDRGQVGSATSAVTVTESRPVAEITYSPSAPQVAESIFFSAEQSTVTSGRQIVSRRWVFGDNTTSHQGPNVLKSYSTAGTYTVQLLITDDFGEVGTDTEDVTIGGTTLTADFVASPTSGGGGGAGLTVNFNATNSTPSTGATITSYAWDFGDGTTGTGVTTSRAYAAVTANTTYTVQLTVTDSNGNTASATAEITVNN